LGKKLYKVSLCSLVLAVIFVPITAPSPKATRPIGDEKCLSCHQEQRSYMSTAHHLTSRPATKDSIAGKFEEGKNILKTAEPELYYRMEAKKDGFFQTAMLGSAPTISRRFDLVIGSGRKGQTYLYWDKNDQLYQLPVSFWTELDTWVHSPGYDDRAVNSAGLSSRAVWNATHHRLKLCGIPVAAIATTRRTTCWASLVKSVMAQDRNTLISRTIKPRNPPIS